MHARMRALVCACALRAGEGKGVEGMEGMEPRPLARLPAFHTSR